MSKVASQITASPHVHQGHLETQLRQLFPGIKIHVEAKKQSNLKYPSTGSYLELDCWIPDLDLCFEFQDSYHYTTTWYTRHNVQNNDTIKQSVIQNRGITLVPVPCWWDGTSESLVATIEFHRPDLFQTRSNPISLNPVQSFFRESPIPDIGELMSASFPLNARFIHDVAENSWWIGEKYDGVRCCWNPKSLSLFTRSGRLVPLPYAFLSLLPIVFLDGEFWFGRGFFSTTYTLCQGDVDYAALDTLRMVAFDSPTQGSQEPFEGRYKKIIETVSSTHQFIVLAKRSMCKSVAHLRMEIAGIIDEEGEGVICRLAGSTYFPGRSPDLVKIKASYGDAEALVVGPSQNSILLKLPTGYTFEVPATGVHPPDREIEKAYEISEIESTETGLGPELGLAIGHVVTFSYEVNARRDVPVNPEIVRIRTDIEWEEVVANYAKDRRFRSGILQNEMESRIAKTSKNLHTDIEEIFDDTFYSGGLFQNEKKVSVKEINQRRQLLEAYAKSLDFDPLVSDNWYLLSKEWINTTKEIRAVLEYYDYSVAKTLSALFPEISLDKSKVNWHVLSPAYRTNTSRKSGPTNDWDDETNRKAFFEDVGKHFSFDPLTPGNWYPLKSEVLLAFKDYERVLQYYDGNWIKGLIALFPSIEFDEFKFLHIPASYWQNIANRRWIFEKYAKQVGFDPETAANWIPYFKEMFVHKAMQGALQFYSGDVGKALVDIFPNNSFDSTKFPKIPGSYLHDIRNRQSFFETFATSRGFHPFDAKNWYSTPFSAIRSQKGSHVAIKPYGGDIVKALMHLFPKIGLDASHFPYFDEYWQDPANRKNALVTYADRNHFDPYAPNNWCTVSPRNFVSLENGNGLIEYYASHSLTSDLGAFFQSDSIEIISKSGNYWANIDNQRDLLIEFAKKKGFNALVAANWYSINVSDFIQHHKGNSLVGYYQGSLINALLHNFPDIGLEVSKFSTAPKNYWQNKNNQKKFFESFAHENGFEPLDPKGWYHVSRSELLQRKGGYAVLKCFKKRNVIEALLCSFPNIGLKPEKFKHLQRRSSL